MATSVVDPLAETLQAPEQVKVAALQMVSGPDAEANFARASALLHEAQSQGVELAVLPENFLTYGQKNKPSITAQKAFITRMSRLTQSLGMWVVAGSYPISPEVLDEPIPEGEGEGKHFAACLTFNDQGDVVDHYLKVHLFDAMVGDAVKTYRESDEYYHGSAVSCVPSPYHALGVAVCYDLRFPELFTRLAQQGARIICIPSAFTETTGRAHWELLLRARAVETQCYIVAANQGGIHDKGRSTWGHSMIVSPWGEILAQTTTGEALVCATLDMRALSDIRTNMPVQSHRRLV